jgi:hypothetical protein
VLRFAVSLIFFWGFLLSAACQAMPVEAGVSLGSTTGPNAESASTSLPGSPAQGDTEMTPSQQISTDAGLQQLIDKTIADLAQELSIPASQIKFMEARKITWPDASLGCPKPGMVYSQVLTPGYVIQLQADNRVYEYHTDADQLIVFCREYPIEFPVKPGDIKDDTPWMR